MDSAIKKLMSEDLGKKFLVWNLSGEDKFNGSRLGDQVSSHRTHLSIRFSDSTPPPNRQLSEY